MLKFCSLYSGSTGNSLLVQSDSTSILVDAGVSNKKIVEALEKLEIPADSISGVLVTHEHSDHIKGLGTFSKKYNIPVFANIKTWQAMPVEREKIAFENQRIITFNSEFSIGDLTVVSFPIPHDAACPCGYNILNSGKKISIATDIGHITADMMPYLENSSFALLESNYDTEVLRYSSYPASLKARISGPNGHLSNSTCGKLIGHLMETGLSSVMLGHLSKENNFPELAYETVLEELHNSNVDSSKIDVMVANRDYPSKFISIL